MTKQEKWDYVGQHYGRDKSLNEIAEITGYCNDNVMAIARTLRKQGANIPKYKIVPVGTITTRSLKGYDYNFIKTEKGWRRMRKDPNDRIYVKPGPKPKPKPKTQVNVKTKSAKTKTPTDPRKPDYQAQGQVRIKPDDLVNNYYQKRDNRTYVLTPR